MEWNASLQTNIELIDTQHKEIVKRINDVLMAVKTKKSTEVVSETLKYLGDYCATHFSQEENLQLRSGYPSYRQHKQMHVKFLSEVKELRKRFETESDPLEIASLTEKTVTNWLINHIATVDKVLAKYLIDTKFVV